jgi:hypothetical protein
MINKCKDYDKTRHNLMLGISFLVGMLRELQAFSATRMACYPPAHKEKEGHHINSGTTL